MRRKLYSTKKDNRVVLTYTIDTELLLHQAKLQTYTPSKGLVRVRALADQYRMVLAMN